MQTNANKTIEVSRSVQELEQNIIHFERQKLEDVKKLLLDLTMIQLKEQVKSMEILTATYQDIAAIDVDKDLEVRFNPCFELKHNQIGLFFFF